MQTKLVNLRAFQHIFIAIAICIITYLCSYRFYRPVLKVDKFIDEMFQNTMPLNLTRTIAQRGARSFSHTTWVSGPPRTRIPFAEKAVHGLLISAGVLFGPMYILVNIENYKKRD